MRKLNFIFTDTKIEVFFKRIRLDITRQNHLSSLEGAVVVLNAVPCQGLMIEELNTIHTNLVFSSIIIFMFQIFYLQ